MTTPLTIVATLTAAEGKTDALRDALNALIAPTRAEAGCIQYDLHEDNQTPGVFLFFELWETRALWQDHMGSAHIAAFGDANRAGGLVAGSELREMSQIS